MSRLRTVCGALGIFLWSAVVSADPWPSIPIPSQNAAALRAPSPRPPVGDLARRAAFAVAAMNGESNAQERALELFLPREPFLAIKDMRGAAGYFAQLVRWYREDLTQTRTELPAGRIEFVRVELSSRCAWMSAGREANRLPYWSCYGSRLVVRAGGREHSLRMHVLINWGEQWYVTHFGPIRRR